MMTLFLLHLSACPTCPDPVEPIEGADDRCDPAMPECPAGTHCVNALLHEEWAYTHTFADAPDPLYLCLATCDDGPSDCPVASEGSVGVYCVQGQCNLGYCKSHIAYYWSSGGWAGENAEATSATTSDSDSG